MVQLANHVFLPMAPPWPDFSPQPSFVRLNCFVSMLRLKQEIQSQSFSTCFFFKVRLFFVKLSKYQHVIYDETNKRQFCHYHYYRIRSTCILPPFVSHFLPPWDESQWIKCSFWMKTSKSTPTHSNGCEFRLMADRQIEKPATCPISCSFAITFYVLSARQSVHR